MSYLDGREITLIYSHYKMILFTSALICLLSLTINHPVFAGNIPPGDIIFGDIIYEGKGAAKGLPSSHFPHWKHRIRYRCSVCHEKIFKMKVGTNNMSMKRFKQGELCGQCHNGKEAYKIGFDTCNRCHNKTAATRPSS
ncbi:MAG: hypothetical protein OEY06_10555 [Gammaproteobacteria bacterium]|nr:hypothetical protein [Gammaproteobacteria bacterium]